MEGGQNYVQLSRGVFRDDVPLCVYGDDVCDFADAIVVLQDLHARPDHHLNMMNRMSSHPTSNY